MEDILSSIKRIIADGSERAAPVRSLRRRSPNSETETSKDEGADMGDRTDAADPADDGDAAILELTDMVEESTEMNEVTARTNKVSQKAAQAPAPSSPQPQALPTGQEDVILSDISTQATRQSLSQLSSLLVRPQEGDANTLEGLVREMLRPMLKEWLEANLPDLVQSMVKKEIDRIVGRLG